jgi:hypothetical protein
MGVYGLQACIQLHVLEWPLFFIDGFLLIYIPYVVAGVGVHTHHTLSDIVTETC